MTRLIATIVLLLAISGSAALAAEGDALLSDDFSTLTEGWDVADASHRAEGNKLLFTPETNKTYSQLYKNRQFGDADIRVKVTCVKGGADGSAGILFWAKDYSNHYYLQMYPDGNCGVTRRVQGKPIYPVGGEVIKAAKLGVGQENELRVVTSGDRATCYVNGEPFVSFKGFPPGPESKAGLRGESDKDPYTWAFADFSVRQGPAPASAAAKDASVLFADDFKVLDPSWGVANETLGEGDRKLILKPGINQSTTRLYRGRFFEDADIRVKVTQAKGGNSSPAGLAFWAADYRNGHVLFVYPEGTAKVAVKSDGKWSDVIKRSKWSAVNTGIGAVNELRVVTTGNSAMAYINGEELGKVPVNDPPGPRQVGLMAEADMLAYTWEFSDLRIYDPETAPPVAAQAELLLADDFSTLKPGWGTASDIKKVEGKKLHVTLKPGLLYRGFYQDAQFGDADIRIKLSASQSDTDEGAGLVFWGIDNANYYAAALQPDGGFYVMRRTRGKSLPTVSSDIRSEALKGLGQTNELRVVTSGSKVSIYINDKRVTEFHGFPPAGGGKIGVYAESGTEPCDWAFSDLSVRKGPAPSGPPQDSSLLFADDFRTFDPAWGSSSPSMKVENGQMVVSLQPQKRRTVFYDGALFDDLDVRLKITSPEASTTAAGLAFWETDSNNYYTASITSAGSLSVARFLGGRLIFPASAKEHDAIQQGAGKTNELRVVTSGSTATIYVNDKQLLSLRGFPPAGGSKIGLLAESSDDPASVRFADLRVKQGPAPPPPPTGPRDETLLFADDFQTLDPGWGYADDAVSVSNGKLRITAPAGKAQIYLNNSTVYDDVDVSFKAAAPAGLTDQNIGFLFWGGRVGHYCVFVVNPKGEAFASTHEGTEYKRTNILKSTSRWLRTGPGEVNELRLVTQGGTALLYANGQFVHSYKGTPPEGGGRVGIYTGAPKDGITLEYSEFRVRKPLVMLQASAERTDGLLLTDDFRALSWGLADEYQRVEGNRLLITPVRDGSRAQFYQGKVRDADIRVKLAQLQGPVGKAAGLAFWAADTSTYYTAFIGSDGRVLVGRRGLEKWLRPVSNITDDVIKKGIGEVNELRVVTSGDRATIYVNDKQMTSFRGFPPRGGGEIGFHSESGAEPTTWAYSDLVIRKGPEPEKSTTPFDATLLYADDFGTLDPAWGRAAQISAGEKHLKMTPTANSGFTKLFEGGFFNDADIRVKLTLTNGETDKPAGIVFWAADYDNYFFACIRPDGRFELYQSKEGKFSPVHPSKMAEEVVKGVGQVNELRVVTKGKTATVYINDKEVDAFESAAPPEGGRQFGFHAESGKEPYVWAFSDLVVRRPK